jgi:hypothetical protein
MAGPSGHSQMMCVARTSYLFERGHDVISKLNGTSNKLNGTSKNGTGAKGHANGSADWFDEVIAAARFMRPLDLTGGVPQLGESPRPEAKLNPSSAQSPKT